MKKKYTQSIMSKKKILSLEGFLQLGSGRNKSEKAEEAKIHQGNCKIA